LVSIFLNLIHPSKYPLVSNFWTWSIHPNILPVIIPFHPNQRINGWMVPNFFYNWPSPGYERKEITGRQWFGTWHHQYYGTKRWVFIIHYTGSSNRDAFTWM
jgi:hypothetical protein